MASVSSLDNDLRNMRLAKYTTAAAKEVKNWIEEVLGERLPDADLLEGLKDGVALCKLVTTSSNIIPLHVLTTTGRLVNLAIEPPGVKYKQSAMPFVQMENISLFLRACQSPPLNLQPHDVFLTVDLYEQKDPAQVMQCICAFSRVANAAHPDRFKRSIGPKGRSGMMSPQSTGPGSAPNSGFSSGRGISNASQCTPAFSPSAKSANVGAMSPSLTAGSNTSKTSRTPGLGGP